MRNASSEAEKMKQMTQKSNHCGFSHWLRSHATRSHWKRRMSLPEAAAFWQDHWVSTDGRCKLRELDLIVVVHRDFKPPTPNRK